MTIALRSLVAFVVVGSACHEPTQANVPPLTTATPSSASTTPMLDAHESARENPTSPWSVGPRDRNRQEGPRGEVRAELFEGNKQFEGATCLRLFLTVAKGSMKVIANGPAANTEAVTLNVGDVLVALHPDPLEVRVAPQGLAAIITQEIGSCAVLSRPASVKTVVRAKEAPELKWANGTMRAHLDVGAKGDAETVSPDLYLGRLEGTGSVAQHTHEGSTEILLAIEASGTFTLNNKEQRLTPGQIVRVSKALHSWRPDPGSRLLAIQLYDPPGPEQRFIALDAAARDAGVK